MFNPELLLLINSKYSPNERRIILRTIFQNPFLENHLNWDDIQKYFLNNQTNSISFFQPAFIALNLLGLDISSVNNKIVEQIPTIESDILKKAADIYQRILLQKGFRPDLKDAFLVSLFLRQHFKQSETWQGISEKIIILDGKENEERNQFWSLVLACLKNIFPDSWKFYDQLLNEKPTREVIKSVIQSLLMNPLSDDELHVEISKILTQQKLVVCIRFLDLLNQFGFPEIIKLVADSILSSSPHLSIGINEIDKSIKSTNWINADDLAQKIQHLAVLYAFAGQQEKASALIDRVKKILEKQSFSLAKIQKELTENSTLRMDDTRKSKSTLPESDDQIEKILNSDKSFFEDEDYLIKTFPFKKIEELISVSNYIEADKQLECIKQTRKSDPNLYRLAAEINIQLGGFQEAHNDILIAQALDSSNHSIQRLLARSYYFQGNYLKALDIMKTLYDTQKEYMGKNVEELCEYALKNNNPEFALNLCQEQISTSECPVGIFLLAAESNYQMKKVTVALDNLQKTIELDKNNPQAWLLLAKIEKSNGDNEKALEALITAKKYAPNSQEIIYELSKYYLECGNKIAYEEMIGEITKTPFISVPLTKEIVQFLGKNQNPQKALTLLKLALNKWPKNIELVETYIELLIEKESFLQAENYLKAFYKNNQLDANGLRDYLFSLLRCSPLVFPINAQLTDVNLQKVSELIYQLSKIAPDDFWTKLIQSEILHLQKKNSEAFDAYRNLLSDLPKSQTDLIWRVQLGLGQILIEIGQPESAIALFSEVLNQSPAIFEIYQCTAKGYQLIGLEEKALQIANQTIEIFSDKSLCYQWYAKFITHLKNKGNAIQFLMDKIKTQKEKNELILLLACVELELGQNEKVEKLLEEIVQHDNIVPSLLHLVASIFAQIGDFSRAINIINKLSVEPEIDQKQIKFELAGLQRQQNNFKESEKTIKENIDQFDGNILQNLLLAEIYFSENDLEQLKPLVISLTHEIQNNQLSSEYFSPVISDEDLFLPDEWKWLFQAKENLGIFLSKCLLSIGDFGKSLEIAENSLNLNPMNLALRKFTAELSRSLLKDSKVDQLAEVNIKLANKNEKDFDNYLELICLRAELALSRREDIYAASLISNHLQGNEDNPRLQCLQARLLNRQGDLENSVIFYRKAKTQIDHLKTENKDTPLLNSSTIWFLESAIENGDFDAVFTIISDLVDSKIITPFVVLAYLKMRIEIEVIKSQAAELMVKNNQSPIQVKSNDYDPMIDKAISNFENNYPDILFWHSLLKLIMGLENDKSILFQETKESVPFLAYWYRKSNNIEGLNLLSQKYSDDPDVHFQIAQLLVSNNPTDSKKHFNEALALNPRNPYFYAALAILENKLNNPQEALKAIDQGLAIMPNEPNWHVFAADMAEKSGEWNKVSLHLEKAIAIEPHDLVVRKRLISAYFQRNRIADAARLIKEISCKGEESFEDLVILAKAALIEKSYKESYDYAARANKLKESSPVPYLILSEIALKLNKLDKALDYAQRAIKYDPEDIDVHLIMSRIICIQKDINSALNYLELISNKGIKSSALLGEIASLRKNIFGTKAALEFLLANQNENDEKILSQIAFYEMELNNMKDAEKYALDSLSLNPQQADLKKILGQIAQKNGNLDQAVKYYSNAISCEPENGERYLDACEIYMYRREVLKAIDVLEQGIQIISNDWRLFQKAGKIYWEMKDYIKAESMIRQASELNPNDLQLERQLSTLSTMNLIHQKQEVIAGS